jgi:hypothetical protein
MKKRKEKKGPSYSVAASNWSKSYFTPGQLKRKKKRK